MKPVFQQYIKALTFSQLETRYNCTLSSLSGNMGVCDVEVQKVETATNGSNVRHVIHVGVSVVLFTPDEASTIMKVAHAVHQEDGNGFTQMGLDVPQEELEHGYHDRGGLEGPRPRQGVRAEAGQGTLGRAPTVLRRVVHAQPRDQGELGVRLADGQGHHHHGAFPAEVVLCVSVSRQGEVQGEDSQVLQITVLHIHRGSIKLRQILNTAIDFLHADGVFAVAVHHNETSEAAAHLKLNSINFDKFEYNTVKFKSCCMLHSLPVFCSTKVAEIVTNKGDASDITKELGQLGSIVHRDMGGKPASKMVVYNCKVKGISSVPGLLTDRRPSRRDEHSKSGWGMEKSARHDPGQGIGRAHCTERLQAGQGEAHSHSRAEQEHQQGVCDGEELSGSTDLARENVCSESVGSVTRDVRLDAEGVHGAVVRLQGRGVTCYQYYGGQHLLYEEAEGDKHVGLEQAVQVLVIPLQFTELHVHRNCIQQVVIPAMVFLHRLESLHDNGGDSQQPGADLHHQGREAGREHAHLLPGQTRCGVPVVSSSIQEDGSEIGRPVTKALLTNTGGDMVPFSVIVLAMSTPSWDTVIIPTSFSACMRSRSLLGKHRLGNGIPSITTNIMTRGLSRLIASDTTRRNTSIESGQRIALGVFDGYHHQQCSQILKASLTDLSYHYYDASMSEVMLGNSIVEFCGATINAVRRGQGLG